MNLSEYILLSRKERTAHINLTTLCVVDESVSVLTRQRRGRQMMMDRLGLNNDVGNLSKAKIHCAHLCAYHSMNGWCTNPDHIYISTALENHRDKPKSARVSAAKTAGETAARSQKGLHDPKNKDRVKAGNSKGGQKTNSKRRMCTVTNYISTPGPLANYQKARGIPRDLYIELDD